MADVARCHDLTRQHIYQWRRELRRKLLWPWAEARPFLPVKIDWADTGPAAPGTGSFAVTVMLGDGQQIRCGSGIGNADLARLIRVVEAA